MIFFIYSKKYLQLMQFCSIIEKETNLYDTQKGNHMVLLDELKSDVSITVSILLLPSIMLRNVLPTVILQ